MSDLRLPSGTADVGAGSGSGLRLRIWAACLTGSLVTAIALAGLAASLWRDSGVPSILMELSLAAVAGLATGALCALWITHAISRRIRRLARSAATAQPYEGPTLHGWGEIGLLGDRLRVLLDRQRQLGRAAEELAVLQRQVVAAREVLARWERTERWEPLPETDGALRPLTATLNRGSARDQEIHEQNQVAARQVREDLLQALEEARESAEQAERSFVESTALLTTIRELQRLGNELQAALASGEPVAAPATPSEDKWREVAHEAITELVTASSASVENLGNGLLRVHEISEQVHLISNRATLIALTAMISANRAATTPAAPDRTPDELKQLTREVRAATERVGELTRQIENEIATGTQRMHEVRDRVAARLEEAPTAAPTAAEAARPREEITRLLDRVREMIQDATRKGERLSASGERASRSAERVARRLEDEIRDIEGMIVRLSPHDAPPVIEPASERPAAEPRERGLRVLGRDDEGQSEPGGREQHP